MLERPTHRELETLQFEIAAWSTRITEKQRAVDCNLRSTKRGSIEAALPENLVWTGTRGVSSSSPFRAAKHGPGVVRLFEGAARRTQASRTAASPAGRRRRRGTRHRQHSAPRIRRSVNACPAAVPVPLPGTRPRSPCGLLVVARARREQVDHQQMDSLAEQVWRLLDHRPKLARLPLLPGDTIR